ncbi:MAG TPA: cupin domain-containing protein [Cyclobacteriaceae bacterium]|nr:cupin domain-containing protein [Cyclobacteriaceae bacterium]
MDAATLIDRLELIPHPEGGYYRETFRATETVLNPDGQIRSAGTSIYYLLEKDNISHFHRIASDETWFFHEGEPIEILMLKNHELITITLGANLSAGEIYQATVPANTWFAAQVRDSKGYSLVSCAVAPGFDFADFELARFEALVQEFPKFRDVIRRFTR